MSSSSGCEPSSGQMNQGARAVEKPAPSIVTAVEQHSHVAGGSNVILVRTRFGCFQSWGKVFPSDIERRCYGQELAPIYGKTRPRYCAVRDWITTTRM
jgi:hypothetical protein